MPLPKLEDWKAPWELKDEEFDEEAARKFIYDLTSDKEKLQGRVDKASTERDEAKATLGEKQKELDALVANGPDADALAKLQAEVREAEGKATAAELKATRLEVAFDKGIPAKQAHRLQGSTQEEIEADADEFLQSFGVNGAKNTEGDEDDAEDDDEGVPSRTPKRLTNPGDAGRGSDSDLIDIDKAIASIPRL